MDVCNEFTFSDQYNIQRDIELNYIRGCINNRLSESDFKHEDNCIKVMSIIDHKTLNVIDGDVKNIEQEISNLRVTILQMLCLEEL